MRDNYERTDSKLAALGALLIAADHMIFEAAIPLTPETDAFFVLLRMAQDTQKQARHAHRMEWVGFGGESPSLTDAEKAEARGETEGAAA